MRSTYVKWRLALLGVLLAVAGWGYSLNTARTIIVHVDVPALAWSGSTLDAKLKRRLSRSGNLRLVTTAGLSADRPEFPHERYHVDSLANWGKEIGGQYLLIIEIHGQRLEKRKSFHLPLVFHMYETVGIMEGEFRLIDIGRGKLLTAETFKVEQRGPRVFQATMDDDINDPDLRLTAPGKVRFFDRLEEKLCQLVADRVGQMVRLR